MPYYQEKVYASCRFQIKIIKRKVSRTSQINLTSCYFHSCPTIFISKTIHPVSEGNQITIFKLQSSYIIVKRNINLAMT